MRIVRITAGTAMALSLTLAPIDAAPKGKAPVKVASKVTPSPKTTKTTAKAPKAPKGATTATASSSPKAKTSKAATASQTKMAKAEAKAARKSGSVSTTTASTANSTITPTTTVDFTQGKVGQKLTRNTKLAEKLAAKLTAMGYTGDVLQAAYGFKNLGQFNAAVNNAQNHNLSFEQLKTLMTGVSVDPDGVVLYANRNADGTVTMVPLEALTDPAPTSSLGQAKKTLATVVVEPEPTAPTVASK